MKKILMALAAAAILAGCSKNEQENVDGFTPKQIKFTNLNDKLTRAANDGNDPIRDELPSMTMESSAELTVISRSISSSLFNSAWLVRYSRIRSELLLAK